MYLDKPMRDHALLQAIARVNRPYENEREEMIKPHGFVLDFVGIFDKLEKALRFDSDEVSAVVKDLQLLKALFKTKMETKGPEYLALIQRTFDDKDVDNLIEHFRDKDKRKEFFKEYKEIEMLYEIISPDAFLRPFIDDYSTLSAIYAVVRKAYTKTVYVDRAFQKKTNELVQNYVDATEIEEVTEFVEINSETIDLIRSKKGGEGTKIINLVKSIQKTAEEHSDDPFLIAMSERAKAVQENFEDRQIETAEALEQLFKDIEENERRKKEQAEKGFDALTYFVYKTLTLAAIKDAEGISKKIKAAFISHSNWLKSDNDMRELRKQMTLAIYAHEDDLDKVTEIVDRLLSLIEQSQKGSA
jgi:type I restriction enzyme R subunit